MLSAAQQVEGGMEGQGQARDRRNQRHKRRDCPQLCVLALGPCSTRVPQCHAPQGWARWLGIREACDKLTTRAPVREGALSKALKVSVMFGDPSALFWSINLTLSLDSYIHSRPKVSPVPGPPANYRSSSLKKEEVKSPLSP